MSELEALARAAQAAMENTLGPVARSIFDARSPDVILDLIAKNKALAERVAGLEEGLSALLRCEYEAAGHGLTDCIDNDGNPYQSAHLEKQIKNAEALVAARTQESGK